MTYVIYFKLNMSNIKMATPRCCICQVPTTRHITRNSNRTGNANRPYYKCLPCNEFKCFEDDRGILYGNPLCECRIPSRMQVSGPHRRVPRGVHYVCRWGECDFYSPQLDAQQQQQLTLDEKLVHLLAGLNII